MSEQKRITILFASENKNKYEEIKKYIDTIPNVTFQIVKTSKEIYEIQSIDRVDIVNVKINDVYINLLNSHALKKFDETVEEHWIMVEDTSFCIEKMGGFPGPFIKYYLNSLSLVKIVEQNCGSAAESICSIGVCKLSSELKLVNSLLVFEGIVKGVIANDVCGKNGFGYDSIFIPYTDDNKEMKTYAEFTMDEKNKLNARILAVEKFMKYLKLA
jgi:non-canonical purine NTP pyrophosphatase (RdgB/HAM1 family)